MPNRRSVLSKTVPYIVAAVVGAVLGIVAWEIKSGKDTAKDLAQVELWHEDQPWRTLNLNPDDATQYEKPSGEWESFAAYRKDEWNRVSKLHTWIRTGNEGEKELANRFSEGGLSSSTRYFNAALARLGISQQQMVPLESGTNVRDCNLSFEMKPVSDVRAVALLIHGLSDSPYHMWAIARTLCDQGCYVIGLRLPGHGTTPAGLVAATFEDWYAATKFGVRMLRKRNPKLPFYMGGFSTGGALCVRYALEAKEKPQRLFLFAPAIAVDNSSAKFAGVHQWLDERDSKIRWTSISPEIDPCRYLSFAKWGGYQVYKLSQVNKKLIDSVPRNEMKDVKIHAFQSAVDATVSEGALVSLFDKLASEESELVLFDVNHFVRNVSGRTIEETTLYLPDKVRLLENAVIPNGGFTGRFHLSWISNFKKNAQDQFDRTPLLYRWIVGGDKVKTVSDLPKGKPLVPTCVWPDDVFAVSHICIPISPEDLFYGKDAILTKIQATGERQVLALSAADDLTRLRYNPFFDYVNARIVDWVREDFEE